PGHIDLPFDKRVDQKLRQGRVAFSTQLRIVDDDGKVLPNDGMAFGHLQAKGPLVTGAYLKQPAAIDAGWLQTGDVAQPHPDGTVELVCDHKHLTKPGGR